MKTLSLQRQTGLRRTRTHPDSNVLEYISLSQRYKVEFDVPNAYSTYTQFACDVFLFFLLFIHHYNCNGCGSLLIIYCKGDLQSKIVNRIKWQWSNGNRNISRSNSSDLARTVRFEYAKSRRSILGDRIRRSLCVVFILLFVYFHSLFSWALLFYQIVWISERERASKKERNNQFCSGDGI